jgi:hypothetical protein
MSIRRCWEDRKIHRCVVERLARSRQAYRWPRAALPLNPRRRRGRTCTGPMRAGSDVHHHPHPPPRALRVLFTAPGGGVRTPGRRPRRARAGRRHTAEGLPDLRRVGLAAGRRFGRAGSVGCDPGPTTPCPGAGRRASTPAANDRRAAAAEPTPTPLPPERPMPMAPDPSCRPPTILGRTCGLGGLTW